MASSTKRRRRISEAEVIARKIDDKNATAYVLSGMGDVALDRGDLTLARKRYEEALALRNQAGEKQIAAESRVSLAKLAIEEGHASDAETSVRAMHSNNFNKEQQADDELTASTRTYRCVTRSGQTRRSSKRNGSSSTRSERRARTAFFVYSSNWPRAGSSWRPIIRTRRAHYFSK